MFFITHYLKNVWLPYKGTQIYRYVPEDLRLQLYLNLYVHDCHMLR